MASSDSNARDSPIDEDENGINGVDVLLDLSRNALLVKGILLRTASVGKTRRVEDANLGKRLRMLTDVYKYWHLPRCRSCSLVRKGALSWSDSD